MSWFGISTQNGTPPIQRGGWLDALRFIVAGLMILHHYEQAAPVALNAFHPVFERGYLLTNFFLIDSGYVLARVYGQQVLAGRMAPRQFFFKRFFRVVPAHLIMCLSLVALVGLSALAGIAPRHPEWFDWSNLPAQLFLVQSYGVPGGLGWNAPSWSLSALLGCYLCFPLLIRYTTAGNVWKVLLSVCGFYLAAHVLTSAYLGFPVWQMPMKFGFLRALPLFFLGMALARFSQSVYVPPRLAAAVGIGAAAALAALQFFGPFSLASMALIGLIILAAGAIPVVRKSKWVEQAALVSFSIFITNEVVRIAYFGVVNVLEGKLGLSASVQWALWAAGMGLAVVFAVVFHHLLDMPLQRWINKERGVPRRRLAFALRLPTPALASA